MKTQTLYMLHGVPRTLGAQASRLPTVSYYARLKTLIVPESLLFDTTTDEAEQTLSDAYLALQKAIQMCVDFEQKIPRLVVRAADDTTMSASLQRVLPPQQYGRRQNDLVLISSIVRAMKRWTAAVKTFLSPNVDVVSVNHYESNPEKVSGKN